MRLAGPRWAGLASGLVAVVLYVAFGQSEEVLAVLSFGYGILQDALSVPPDTSQSLFTAALLMAVALGKIVTTGLTIGSGGSAGVFGPSMVIGGCGGEAAGHCAALARQPVGAAPGQLRHRGHGRLLRRRRQDPDSRRW